MPSLVLLTPGTHASLERERVMLLLPPDEKHPEGNLCEMHLRDIEQVIATPSVSITMPLLAEWMKREVPLIMTAGGGKVLGLSIPMPPPRYARLAQYKAVNDHLFCLAIATSLVEAKILNSRRVLQRLATNREDEDVTLTLKTMKELARKSLTAEDMDTLRGFEGAAAGAYFKALGKFFPTFCPFEYRSRRPPKNPPNAILSFAYTLLAAELECQCYATGLDPALGLFHETQDGRQSLALDLIEPFRACMADAMAVDLINHETLKPGEHFEKHAGGIYLNRVGKKRFFAAYERRLTREFMSEQTGKRTSLRGEMQRSALGLKQAVMDDALFEPFRMN